MDYDYELHELLQEAIDEGWIDESSAACGVAKQCVDRGYDSLSNSQKATYDNHVTPHLTRIVQRRELNDRLRGMPD